MSTTPFEVRGEYIELQQLLKALGVIDLGSQARDFLADGEVLVNGESETRRGRKLRSGDRVELPEGEVIEIE